MILIIITRLVHVFIVSFSDASLAYDDYQTAKPGEER